MKSPGCVLWVMVILSKVSLVVFGDGLNKACGRTRESPVGFNTYLWTDRPQRRNFERGISEDHKEIAYGEDFKMVNSKIVADL